MDVHIFRLKPGEDLLLALDRYLEQHQIQAGILLTCVGSLRSAVLRLADQHDPTELPGPVEIVSLEGTLSTAGSHLHLSISDSRGKTTGGHLLPGNLIYTTAEIALGELPDLQFRREPCAQSGYAELVVQKLDIKK